MKVEIAKVIAYLEKEAKAINRHSQMTGGYPWSGSMNDAIEALKRLERDLGN